MRHPINQGYKPKTCVFNSYQIYSTDRSRPAQKGTANHTQRRVLALTIKHTVEFSKNGRSPFQTFQPVLGATSLAYPNLHRLSNPLFRANPTSLRGLIPSLHRTEHRSVTLTTGIQPRDQPLRVSSEELRRGVCASLSG